MILGKPTLQTVLKLIEDEGCPRCGDTPPIIHVNGPDEIVLECGQVLDAKRWIDSSEPKDEADDT
jgi:hypothetical protein